MEGCAVKSFPRGPRIGTSTFVWSSEVNVWPSTSSVSVSFRWVGQIRSVILSPAGHEFTLDGTPS